MELKLARTLRDKLLHTDALMNKANWQTGLAGMLGIAGIGFGLWWADAVAAAIISASIIWDGWQAMKVAAGELVDGVPRELGSARLSQEARALGQELRRRYPQAERILLRETGRFIRAEVVGAASAVDFDLDKLDVDGCDRWRIDSISFRPSAGGRDEG